MILDRPGERRSREIPADAGVAGGPATPREAAKPSLNCIARGGRLGGVAARRRDGTKNTPPQEKPKMAQKKKTNAGKTDGIINLSTITDRQKLIIKNGINTYLYIMDHATADDLDFRQVYYDFYLSARSSVFAQEKQILKHTQRNQIQIGMPISSFSMIQRVANR